MNFTSKVQLLTRSDSYSHQVYCPADEKFWFRLVRERDHDQITDYFVGSFPKEQSGVLLQRCYSTLGLRPLPMVVFKDILSGRSVANTESLKDARTFYEGAGFSLFSKFGLNVSSYRLEEVRGKINLIMLGTEGTK